MPELQLVAFLSGTGRIGVAHIVRLPPGPIWKGQTWCSQVGNPYKGRKVDLSRKPVCKNCLRAKERAGG